MLMTMFQRQGVFMNSFKQSTFLLLCGVVFFATLQNPTHAAVPTAEVPAATDTMLQLARTMTLHDGSFVGGTYSAYYGPVQVQVTVRGGVIVDGTALKFPNKSGTSRSINRQALPYLKQELISAQSGRINLISGATLTSKAYVKSLRDALNKAAQ
jgi:uncharacterized protein with FMN-binding domain